MVVLFDLDGTIFDTSHDIYNAVNQLLSAHKKDLLDYNQVRNLISLGSKDILAAAVDNPDALVPQLIELCIKNGFANTTTFPGIDQLLKDLEDLQLSWGIVTNRSTAITTPLLAAAGYLDRAKCVVCGDTTDRQKPDPKPLLHAAKLLNSDPAKCIYIGDAITDIQAGKAAGMSTIAAAFGFVNQQMPVAQWHADHIVEHAAEILPWIKQKWAL